MSGQALLHHCHWLCNQKHPWGICSCSPIVNFLKVTFYHEMVSLVIFLIKKHLNRHIKHENLLSIYENMGLFSNHVVHCDMLKISENTATIY